MSFKTFRNLLVFSVSLIASYSFGQEIKYSFRPSGFCGRDLLGLGPPVDRLSRMAAVSETLSDTVRILAIRVDFQEDDNTLTTGNGKFDLTTSFEGLIDPPPHDRAYFENQLSALSNYFNTVSHGKLVLQADVYPQEANRTYTLSDQMSSYVPVESEDLLDQRLSELFQEGLQIADATDQIDFSRYDSFILFHAGVGGDFAFDFDPTPQDVPSVFLDFATLRRRLGNNDINYQGIAVNGGSVFVKDGMILPETQSQEGFEIALLGTMAIQFGHQLGLPNLFSTNTGRPGIGIFGLMDQGSGNFIGLLPAEPSAWSKVFLGWETPIEVRNGDSLPVAASQAAGSCKIYKIPVDSREYFLVENRFRDMANDQIAIGRDANGTRVEFRWDDQGQRLLADGPIGVITEVNEYDFGLPGSGILVWHVDERIIAENFEANLVNGDRDRRGIDLEEADGAQDIGQVYGLLSPGAGAENGVIEDMFWGSNPINMLVNDSSAVVEFTPTTTPNSLSNSGANTGIFITDFSEPGEVMTFSVRENLSQPGFPQFVGGAGRLTNSPTVADLDLDGTKEIIWASNEDTQVFVWNSDGSKFIPNDETAQAVELNGNITTFPLALFAEPEGTFAYPPVVARLNELDLAIVVVTDGVIAAYAPKDIDQDGRGDLVFVRRELQGFTTPPMVVSTDPNQIVVGTAGGAIISFTEQTRTTLASVGSGSIAGLALLSSDAIAFATSSGEVGALSLEGSVIWQNSTDGAISVSPVVGDLDRDGRLDVIAITEAGELSAFDAGGERLGGFPSSIGVERPSHMALGDANGDGFLEIHFSASGRLYAFNHIGSLLNNFPIRISGDTALSRSSPILTDLSGDGLPEIIIGSPSNQLAAYDANGNAVSGFPLPTGAGVNSTAGVSDLDNDGDLDVVAVSDDGFLYASDLAVNFTPGSIAWGGFLRDAGHSNANLEIIGAPPPAGRLMPPNLVYNYPNPTDGNRTTIRYLLNSQAEVAIKIYDMAGELVDELAGPGFGQAENEVDWRLDKIESGVYLARVEARTDTDSDVVIFKIAVVK